MSHDPKPYCPGIDCHKDYHKHPALFMGGNLAAIHERWGVKLEAEQQAKVGSTFPLAQVRPEDDFPVGSEWYYGPNYENMDTRVRVVEPPKQSNSMRDFSLGFKRNGSYVEGPHTWFVRCEVICAPHYQSPNTGLRPCALIPAAAVDAERGLRSNCSCCSAMVCCRRCTCEPKPSPALGLHVHDMLCPARERPQPWAARHLDGVEALLREANAENTDLRWQIGRLRRELQKANRASGRSARRADEAEAKLRRIRAEVDDLPPRPTTREADWCADCFNDPAGQRWLCPNRPHAQVPA